MNQDFISSLAKCDLSDVCPCGTQNLFGSCCGSEFECECKSHLSAGECCYEEKKLPQPRDFKNLG